MYVCGVCSHVGGVCIQVGGVCFLCVLLAVLRKGRRLRAHVTECQLQICKCRPVMRFSTPAVHHHIIPTITIQLTMSLFPSYVNSHATRHVNNITTMLFLTRIPRNTQSNSYMLSLIDNVRNSKILHFGKLLAHPIRLKLAQHYGTV